MKGGRIMEILADDEEERLIRFQSNCHEPGCAIDICELKGESPRGRFIQIYFYATPARLRDRIRWCWHMLTRGTGFEHEFFVRPADIKDLAGVIAGEIPPSRPKL
jgi:hypothetical protein